MTSSTSYLSFNSSPDLFQSKYTTVPIETQVTRKLSLHSSSPPIPIYIIREKTESERWRRIPRGTSLRPRSRVHVPIYSSIRCCTAGVCVLLSARAREEESPVKRNREQTSRAHTAGKKPGENRKVAERRAVFGSWAREIYGWFTVKSQVSGFACACCCSIWEIGWNEVVYACYGVVVACDFKSIWREYEAILCFICNWSFKWKDIYRTFLTFQGICTFF